MVVLTDHCKARAQQRGIKKPVVEIIFEHGDLVFRGKYGRIKLGISKRKIARLLGDGVLRPALADKLSSRWIIAGTANDNDDVVTVYFNKSPNKRDWRRKRGEWKK